MGKEKDKIKGEMEVANVKEDVVAAFAAAGPATAHAASDASVFRLLSPPWSRSTCSAVGAAACCACGKATSSSSAPSARARSASAAPRATDSCGRDQDCSGGACGSVPPKCIPVTCLNGARDEGETDVDCGGEACGPCESRMLCDEDSSCLLGVCDADLGR